MAIKMPQLQITDQPWHHEEATIVQTDKDTQMNQNTIEKQNNQFTFPAYLTYLS